MSEKVLTKEIAEQFIADEYSVDLSQYTSLEEEAAISLSKSDTWQIINLDGVTDLTESIISVFVDHRNLPSLKGWSGMNDKLAEFVLSSENWEKQRCLSLDSKKLLIPYLPEKFILLTCQDDYEIECYEVIERESYKELLHKIQLDGFLVLDRDDFIGTVNEKIEFSELIDSIYIWRTSEEAVVAFDETLGFSCVQSMVRLSAHDILDYDAEAY